MSPLNFAFLSGRQDSNLRPPAPKAGTLTGLRYAPNISVSKTERKCSIFEISTIANREYLITLLKKIFLSLLPSHLFQLVSR